MNSKNSDFEPYQVLSKSQHLLPPHLLKILLMRSDLMSADLMADLFYLTNSACEPSGSFDLYLESLAWITRAFTPRA